MVKKSKGGSTRTLYLALGAVALIGLAYVGWRSTQGGGEADFTNVQPGTAEGVLYGDPNAPVTIMEFADFECPACAQWATVQKQDVIDRLIATGQANLRFFDFPLPIHPNTTQASLAAACAGDQDRFWEMHDRIFQGQPEWAGVSRPKRLFERYAREVGVDVSAWNACYEEGKHVPRILANRAEGERRGVNSTPTFIIGRRVRAGVLPYDVIKAMVDSAMMEQGATPTDAAPGSPTGQ